MNKQVEALKLAEESLEGWKEYDTWTDQQMWNDDDEKALAAIREALAEPELNLNCKSVQARLATVWGYVKAEPVKQEPVAWHEPNAYGNVTTHKKWAEENGWLPLYTKE